MRRALKWLSNPWGKPRWLVLITLIYMVWSIVPILIAIRFSFNDGRSRSTFQGWSTRWYYADPDNSVWHDPSLHQALIQSLKLAGLAMVITVPLGIALALALARWRGRGSGSARFLALFPIVTPEIVMGTALFLTFIHLLHFIHLGTTAQVLGHVTFSVSFVVIIVRARLLTIGKEYEEAAMDLGASPVQALRMVLLPLLTPAVFASFMMVFAISIDDFVISAFLSSSADTETIPIKIYANARGAPTPALNALASVMLFATLIAVFCAYLLIRVTRPVARAERESAFGDFAQLQV
jgi:spermidine/putrescine transport system permease protein